MAYTTDPNIIRNQMDTRKNILLVYIILGAALVFVGIVLDDNIYPASFLFIGAVVIAFIFYTQISGYINNPQPKSLNSLQTIMYLFTGIFIVALIVDVIYWEALWYTTFLGAVLAVAGMFIMIQIISEGKLLLNPDQGSQVRSQPQRVGSSQSGDKITQLERLSDLRDRGALSESEYEKEKAKVLQKFD